MPEQDLEYDVFIHNAEHDNAWCEQLTEHLNKKGLRVCFDSKAVRSEERIRKSLKKSRKMIAVLNPVYVHGEKAITIIVQTIVFSVLLFNSISDSSVTLWLNSYE